eukprot:CAMPEP_0116826448 /NCGR_PEP_ID=MMETSP0418-20121206/2534_1 /TAXON_ID=1158023 /ORGANISM="Astrosyne radiata, Strain 13vi08-1A" /LENGTH=140 /DNA_ID=CAMNT_0004455083 /DNA_START=1541 /DNA_END=1963 /DNA_ORIENTATION=+
MRHRRTRESTPVRNAFLSSLTRSGNECLEESSSDDGKDPDVGHREGDVQQQQQQIQMSPQPSVSLVDASDDDSLVLSDLESPDHPDFDPCVAIAHSNSRLSETDHAHNSTQSGSYHQSLSCVVVPNDLGENHDLGRVAEE